MPMDSRLANKAFDAETTRLLGSTFDAAWERVEASDRLPSDKRQVASMRELLANFIIRMVEQGERDPNRLIESALVRLRIISRHDGGAGEASKIITARDEQARTLRSAPNADLRRARFRWAHNGG